MIETEGRAEIALAELRLRRQEIEEARHAKERAQAFFAEMAAEMRRPHYGGPAKEYTRALLLRAQEAGLYRPEEI